MDIEIVGTMIIIGIMLIGLFASIGGACIINGIGASDGHHTGYVTAVEYNTNLVWDANIVYFKTDTESTQEDKYCVTDETLKFLLEENAKTKQQITIHYKNPFIVWKSICNGGESIIVGFEE